MVAAVTGANGFIGSQLATALAAAGWEVRAVVRPKHQSPPSWIREPSGSVPRIQWRPTDFHDPAALAGVLGASDVVFHVAGATRAPTPAGLEDANAGLTRAMLAATPRARAPRFVYL